MTTRFFEKQKLRLKTQQQEKIILYQEAVLVDAPIGMTPRKREAKGRRTDEELISTIDSCHNSHPKQQTMTTIMDSILKI